MTRAEAIEILKKLIEAMQGHVTVLPTPERIAAIRLAIASLETDEAYQLEYEKPTTKNDLGVTSELEKNSKKLEKDFGELDCISRKAVLDAIDSKAWEFCDYLISKGRNDEQKPVSHFADNLRECVREELPSVTPQEPKTGHCRDCKWWKDSDGAYRRGIGAESKCPMNRKEVYEGNGYCFLFEPQESEDNNGSNN